MKAGRRRYFLFPVVDVWALLQSQRRFSKPQSPKKKKEPSKQMVTGQRVTWNRSQKTIDIEGCLCSTGSDKELPEYSNGIQ